MDMLVWQILGIGLFVFLVVLCILAIVEPGPLTRRKKERPKRFSADE